MIRGKFAVVLILLPTVHACGAGTDGSPVTVLRDSAGITIAESRPALAPTCSLAAEPRSVIGAVSGDPMQELHRVFGAGLLSTGEIAVANQGSQEVRIYDARGQFVRAFGREGDGPGEFRDVFGLWILPGDTLWVGDYRPWRYQVYSAKGQWVRTVQPEPTWVNPPREWGMLSDGRAVIADDFGPTADRTFSQTWLRVVLHDPQGLPVDTLGPLPYGRRGRTRDDPSAIVTYPFFEPSTELAAAGQRLAIGPGAEPTLSVFDMTEDGMDPGGEAPETPGLIIRWDAGDRTVTTADIAAEKDRIRERYAQLSAGAQQIGQELVSDSRPAAESFPAYVGLMFGTDGSLWVSEYHHAGTQERTRLVFDRDGRLRCRAVTPADLEPFEFGADYVLGKQRDAMDVERVVLYDLLRADR